MNAAGREVVVADQDQRAAAVGQVGAEGHSLDVVERDPEHVQVEQQRLLDRLDAAEQRRQAVEAVDVVRAGERDVVELDRVAGARRADRERALHREQELVVQRQQLDEAVDRELVCGHGRLGDRIRPVDVLPVELAALQVVAQDPRRAARGDRRRGPVLDERVLGRGEEEAAVRRRPGALEAEVLADAARSRCVRQEGGRNRQRTQLAPVERELAHPGVDQPVGEPLGRDHERVVLRQRQPFRIEAERRERLAGGVAKRRHGDDLHGGSAAADADPQRVEARVDLVVGEDVEDAAALVVGDAGQPAERRSLKLGRGREDLLAEELQLRRRRGLRGCGRHERDREQEDEPDRPGLHPVGNRPTQGGTP